MPKLATWLREKDKRWFQPFFDKHPEIRVCNALEEQFDIVEADGLLLTGGSDIAPEFLKQEIPDPSVLEADVDPIRDRWEFTVIPAVMDRGLPVLAICKG